MYANFFLHFFVIVVAVAFAVAVYRELKENAKLLNVIPMNGICFIIGPRFFESFIKQMAGKSAMRWSKEKN